MKKIILNNKKTFVFLLLIISVLAVLNLSNISQSIKNFFFIASSSTQQYFWQAGQKTANFFSFDRSNENLQEEIARLKAKNYELLGRIADLDELKKENEELRRALDLDLEQDFHLIIGRAISKDVFIDSILINRGSRDGVLENQPVITSEKILIGKVGQVYNNFAEVILISNKKSSFDAKIIDRDIFGLIRGKGGNKVYFDLISKDEQISSGEVVVSSALGGVFPSGLLVGEITAVEKSDLDPFQQAEIDSFLDINKLDHLFIIKSF